MKKMGSVPIFVLLGVACCCYTSGKRGGGSEPQVRVRLSDITSEARVSCDAGLAVRAGRDGRRAESRPVTLRRAGKAVAVEVGGQEWRRTADTVRLSGSRNALIRVGERSYRGAMLAFVNGGGALVVANELGIEDYLRGVVPSEIGPLREETIEAVKAQAVAARSFTLTRLSARKGLGHQLFDTYKRDQEYKGAGVEHPLASRAVDATRGQVLVHAGAPAEALYHACCGGRTAPGSSGYLVSVRDAPGGAGKAHCAESKHYNWTATFTRREFEEKLGGLAKLAGRPSVRSVRQEKDGSGRTRWLHCDSDRGGFRVAGTELRFGLGLKSTLFELKLGRDRVEFTGRGWGHGAGMCQDGAVAMARRGSDWRRILRHYYPKLGISRYW
ncbi:SpoIID/LytB domain-containing protein [candidate division WOR-3 bacterium]|nr:SpoIID/LytB domain-containing protein [candidate division WOR-3 bacterium]